MPQPNQPWNTNPAAAANNQQAAYQTAPQDRSLSDQEMAFDLLYQEKALMVNVASDVLEVAHPGLRQVLNDCYLQMGQDQLDIFNAMHQKNWYQTKPAQPQDIQTAKQKFQQMRNTI